MLDRLSIKLIFPMILVGFIGIAIILFQGSEVSKTMVVSVFVGVIFLQIMTSYLFFEQQLSQRLQRLKNYLDLVVNKDKAPSKALVDTIDDELGAVTNELSGFVDNLRNVIDEIRAESDMLRQGSEQLSNHMSESVSSVDSSAYQIEQMAQSFEQVAATSSVLSESASQVSETSNQVLDILSQGTSSSNTSQKTIELVAQEVNGTADDLALLQEECSRIGSVLDVIRGIAEQTNLLALNAAIEAARAGEQGRGFAVVADEVRALAHRTQESTVEIQSMVEGLQDKSNNAVNAITKGQTLTQESLSHSEEVVSALKQIGKVFTEVNTLTSQIAQGTNEQQQSTASISDNMSAVVKLSKEINNGLLAVAQHAEQQKATAAEVDITLNKICV